MNTLDKIKLEAQQVKETIDDLKDIKKSKEGEFSDPKGISHELIEYRHRLNKELRQVARKIEGLGCYLNGLNYALKAMKAPSPTSNQKG